MTNSEVRLYSGWRRSRGLGFFGLGPVETSFGVAVVGLWLVVLVVGGIRAGISFVWLPLLCGLALLPIDGLRMHWFVRREFRWLMGTLRNRRNFRSGLLHQEGMVNDQVELPGALAPTDLLVVTALSADPFGVILNRTSGEITVSLSALTQAAWLADAGDFDGWVGNWHRFLAATSFEPSLSHISVVVDSSTLKGEVFAKDLRASVVPEAPTFAAELVAELANMETTASKRIEVWIEITFDPAKGAAANKSVDEQVTEIVSLLPGLEQSLLASGISSLHRATPAQMGRRLRVAYDPAVAADAEEAELADPENDGLGWRSSGPIALDEQRSVLMHDSGATVGYVWSEPPRSAVDAKVLSRLLDAGVHQRRVTLLWEPTPSALGAAKLEAERTAAKAKQIMAQRARADETAKNELDRAFADMAAREEAAGAGLGRMWMFVSTTVERLSDLPDAMAEVEQRAGESRIKLRRATCSHATVASIGVGAGIHPARLAKVGWRS